MGFIFGPGTNQAAPMTPQDLQNERALVTALMQRQYTPKNLGEGLSAIGDALGTRFAAQKLNSDVANTSSGARALMDNLFAPSGAGAPAASVSSAAAPGDTFGKILMAESDGDPNAVSPKGATGIAQVMPATARDPGFGLPNIFDFAKSQGVNEPDTSDASLQDALRNPAVNAGFGKLYFEKMKELNGGSDQLAAASYNAGPGAVAQAGGIPNFPETQAYVSKVAPGLQPIADAMSPMPNKVVPASPDMMQAAPYRAGSLSPQGLMQPMVQGDPVVTPAGAPATAAAPQQPLTQTPPSMQPAAAPTPGQGMPSLQQLQKAMSDQRFQFLAPEQQDLIRNMYQTQVARLDPNYQITLQKNTADLQYLLHPDQKPLSQADQLALQKQKLELGYEQHPETKPQSLPVFGKVGVDPNTGLDQYGFPPRFNTNGPQTGPIINGEVAPAGAATAGAGVPAPNNGPHGEDYLATLTPERASVIRSIIEGQGDYPVGRQAVTPMGLGIIEDVRKADPSFQPGLMPARKAMIDNVANGPLAVANNKQNAAIGHLKQLYDLIPDIGTKSSGFMSGPINDAIIGYKQLNQDPALAKFDTIKNQLASEISGVYGEGTEAAIARKIDLLGASNSPEEKRAIIATIGELMKSKIQANQYQYDTTMGPYVKKANPMVSPASQAALDAMTAGEPVKIQSDADYSQLPSGAAFVGPDGIPRRKP